MAIIFELWAECSDEPGTRKLLNHFDGLQHELESGLTVTWRADLVGQLPRPPGLRVSAKELGTTGITSIEDAVNTSEAGLLLYDHLRHGPEFLYSFVGLEAENVPLSDLPDYISAYGDGQRDLSVACALHESILASLGDLTGFVEFRPGYKWIPYTGEKYSPLYGIEYPHLRQLRSRLFAT